MSEIEKITSDIDSRFKSLNSVQVSDVRLTRNEWAVIKQSVLARLPKPEADPVAWQHIYQPAMFCRSKVWVNEEPNSWRPVYTHPTMNTAEREAEIHAKLSERKTVHLWLNDLNIPTHEATGKPMCLLRRLAVALKVSDHFVDANKMVPGDEYVEPVSPEVEARVDAAVKAGRINDKRDAERDALVARIDSEWLTEHIPADLESLLRDIRAHLVGGA